MNEATSLRCDPAELAVNFREHFELSRNQEKALDADVAVHRHADPGRNVALHHAERLINIIRRGEELYRRSEYIKELTFADV